jgi:hypothetical protein
MTTRTFAASIIAGVLAGLTLTSAAGAGCAWVLWDGALPRVPGADTDWSIRGTYANSKQCNVALGDVVQVMKQRGTEVTAPLDGTSLYKKLDGERGYLHCVPDTVDPRGPRATR